MGMDDIATGWQQRAAAATGRHDRLMSFGANTCGVMVRTRHGMFAVDPEDGGVSAYLLDHGSYGDAEIEAALPLIAGGDVLVVGAHIGAFVVPLARACRELIAVEANPRTFELLSANVGMSGCSNITLLNHAASNRAGETIQFLLSRDNSGGSKRRPISGEAFYMYDDPAVIEIEASRLDDVIGARAFDLIVMDIEGSEYFALRGMQEILHHSRALAVEFRPHHIHDVAGVSIDEFASAVAPFFDWLYVPGWGGAASKDALVSTLATMYAENQCHEVIYFFKELPKAWPPGAPIAGAPVPDDA